MIQKKRRRRAVLNRVAPTTGRQAFRGMIQPLMLAGGASPAVAQSLGEMYANSIVVKPVENTVPTDLGKEPCPMSQLELDWCEWNSNNPWCKKRGTAKGSKECTDTSTGTAECPVTAKLKEVCSSSNKEGKLARFCYGMKIGGQCVDEYVNDQENIEDSAELTRKQRQQEANDNWVKTRGCSFQRNDLTPQQIEQMRAKGINPITTKTPCTYPEFNNAKPGDVVTINRLPWKFISWNPAEPPVITN